METQSKPSLSTSGDRWSAFNRVRRETHVRAALLVLNDGVEQSKASVVRVVQSVRSVLTRVPLKEVGDGC